MSKNLLPVRIRESKKDGVSYYDGTVELAGVLPTKITKSRSRETKFSSRTTLTQSANSFAKRHGYSGVDTDTAKSTKRPTTKACFQPIPAEAADLG